MCALAKANGGLMNYIKVRDLGSKLGFNVARTAKRGVYIESGRVARRIHHTQQLQISKY